MSYRIDYNDGEKQKGHFLCQTVGRNPIAVAIIVSAILLLLTQSALRESMKAFLLPGDRRVTEAAMDSLVVNVKDGVDVETALTDFCLEILRNGKDSA